MTQRRNGFSERLDRDTEQSMREILNEESLDIYKYKARTRQFVDLVPYAELSDKSKVLEVGVGTGVFSVLIREQVGCRVHAIDLKRDESEDSKAQQQKWIQRYNTYDIDFQYCDIVKKDLPFASDEFDMIIFTEVLEHLITDHPPLYLFEEFKRVLNKEGVLILTTPNSASINNRILWLAGKNPYYGKTKRESYSKHFKEYTQDELIDALESVGFSIEESKFGNQRHKPSLERNIGSIIFYISHYLSEFFPKFRNTHLIRAR